MSSPTQSQKSSASPGKRVTGGGLASRLSFRRSGNNLRIGLIGYPNAGKSSLYNVLMQTGRCRDSGADEGDGFAALVDEGLFTTVDPNLTSFTMDDERHAYLKKVYAPVLTDEADDGDEESEEDFMTSGLLTMRTTASNPSSPARLPAANSHALATTPAAAATSPSRDTARERLEVSFADDAFGLRGTRGIGTGTGSPGLLGQSKGSGLDLSGRMSGRLSARSHGSHGSLSSVKAGRRLPGAGNRITLIDTAGIVPGSLSAKVRHHSSYIASSLITSSHHHSSHTTRCYTAQTQYTAYMHSIQHIAFSIQHTCTAYSI
jgi:hypothetical protein